MAQMVKNLLALQETQVQSLDLEDTLMEEMATDSNILGGGLVTKSCPTLVTPWIVACQAPLSMGFPQARILEWIANYFSRGYF